jgi:hypothetical protein
MIAPVSRGSTASGPEVEIDYYLRWTVERVAAGHGQIDRHVEAWRRATCRWPRRRIGQTGAHPALRERLPATATALGLLPAVRLRAAPVR